MTINEIIAKSYAQGSEFLDLSGNQITTLEGVVWPDFDKFWINTCVIQKTVVLLHHL